MSRLRRLLRQRLHDDGFWRVQAAVGGITAFHYVAEFPDPGPPFDHLHHLAPAMYIFPIIYASLRFGREGGAYTGLWCAVLTLPNIALWHQSSLEWVVEATQIGIAVTVGLVLSARVEREAVERRRAERLFHRVSMVNREIMRAQEEERLRIARDLHDETVQDLALLSRRLDDVLETSPLSDGGASRIRELRAIVDRTVVGVRRFSRDLRPPALDDLGLVPAIESLIRDLSERTDAAAAPQALHLRLETEGEPQRLDSEVEIALFRIVQEALSNVTKHADAAEVIVTVKFEQDRARIEIRDDGGGFDASVSADDLLADGKLGLAGMHERAQLVGATLDVHSQIDAGTVVTVGFPLGAKRSRSSRESDSGHGKEAHPGFPDA